MTSRSMMVIGCTLTQREELLSGPHRPVDVFKHEQLQKWKRFCHRLLRNVFECTKNLFRQPAGDMQRPCRGKLVETCQPLDVVDIVPECLLNWDNCLWHEWRNEQGLDRPNVSSVQCGYPGRSNEVFIRKRGRRSLCGDQTLN